MSVVPSSNHASCDPKLLEGYLAQTLRKEDELRVEALLNDCHACQSKIVELAATEAQWKSAGLALGDSHAVVQRSQVVEFGDRLWTQATTSSSCCSTLPSAEDILASLKAWLIPSTNPDSLGQVGKYEILELIGQGGMGLVLKGLDTELKRMVAIKTLPRELVFHTEARSRLSREARAAAALQHQNVMLIHALESWNNIPYIVMPFVEGGNLYEYVKTTRLTLMECLQVALQVSNALEALHQAGIIHRDLKPSNILLGNDLQHVILSDFGLARIRAEESITESDTLAGTPYFMAPEQARGKSIEKSDLFSLGCVLYWLLTNHYPFRGETKLETLMKIVEQEVSFANVDPPIPEPVKLLLIGLLQKAPEKRWENASQVSKLVKECIAHFNDSRHPLPKELQKVSNVPKRRVAWALGAILFVSSAISLGLWILPTPNTETNLNHSALAEGHESSISTSHAHEILKESPVKLEDEPSSTINSQLSESERKTMLADLRSGVNQRQWLRRLANLPSRFVPSEVFELIEPLLQSHDSIERELALIIVNRNPFEEVYFLDNSKPSLSSPQPQFGSTNSMMLEPSRESRGTFDVRQIVNSLETGNDREAWLMQLTRMAPRDIDFQIIQSILSNYHSLTMQERVLADQLLDKSPFAEVAPGTTLESGASPESPRSDPNQGESSSPFQEVYHEP